MEQIAHHQIPKIIHQIWLGNKPVPAQWANTWKAFHPTWEYRLWREADIDSLCLTNRELYDRYAQTEIYCSMADVARVEILERFGGVYVDMDTECLRSLEGADFLESDFFAVRENPDPDSPHYSEPDRVANGIIGCVKGSKVITEYRIAMGQAKEIYPGSHTTGGSLLTRILRRHIHDPRVRVLQPWTFFPVSMYGISAPGGENAYARHYWGTTWDLYKSNPQEELAPTNDLSHPRDDNHFTGKLGYPESQEQLVSVIIPTHNRRHFLVTRALPSVLNQTYKNLEVIIVADRCSDDTRERVQQIADPRIKFIELVDRPPLPDDSIATFKMAPVAPRNRGLEAATGDWITYLDDDDELTLTQTEALLQRALMGYDFVYGKFLVTKTNGEIEVLGQRLSEYGQHLAHGSFMYSSKYKDIQCNVNPVATEETNVWNVCRRIIEAGARVSFVDRIVLFHYPSERPWEEKAKTLKWRDRIYLPWQEGAKTHYEHLHKYAFASRFTRDKKVIDLVCGEGYGVALLAKRAQYVIGIEKDEKAVIHAKCRYQGHNIKFMQGSAFDVPIRDERMFDVVVCFEDMECMEDYHKVLAEVKRLLTDDGIFIASIQNKPPHGDKTNYPNEFKALLSSHFKNVHLLGQRVCTGSTMWNLSPQEPAGYIEFVVEKGNAEFSFTKNAVKAPSCFIALASDGEILPSIITANTWLIDVSDSLEKDYEKQLSELGQTIQAKNNQITELNSTLQEKDSQVRSLAAELGDKSKALINLQNELAALRSTLMWRAATALNATASRLLPPGTKRRRLARLALRGLLNPAAIPRNLNWRNVKRFLGSYTKDARIRYDMEINYPIISTTFKVSGNPEFWKRLENGWEGDCIRHMVNTVRQRQVILDIGAWFGPYTLLFAKLVGKTGKVYSLEPNPKALAILQTNIQANSLQNVIVEELAASNVTGQTKLYLYNDWEDSASNIVGIQKRSAEPPIDVKAATIDSLCRRRNIRPDGIKIDVEGAEARVIEGAQEVLKKYSPWVLLEFHSLFMNKAEREGNWNTIVNSARKITFISGNSNQYKYGSEVTSLPDCDYFHVFIEY